MIYEMDAAGANSSISIILGHIAEVSLSQTSDVTLTLLNIVQISSFIVYIL